MVSLAFSCPERWWFLNTSFLDPYRAAWSYPMSEPRFRDAAAIACGFLDRVHAEDEKAWVSSSFVLPAAPGLPPGTPAVTLETRWEPWLEDIVKASWWADFIAGRERSDALVFGSYAWYPWFKNPSGLTYAQATAALVANLTATPGFGALRPRLFFRTVPLLERLIHPARPMFNCRDSRDQMDVAARLFARAGVRVLNMSAYSLAERCPASLGCGGACPHAVLSEDNIHPKPYVNIPTVRALLSQVALAQQAVGGTVATSGARRLHAPRRRRRPR